jgi:Holliday junction resolvase RusA-like endonuclease
VQIFTIKGRLPSRNEITAADRGNRYAANKLKKSTERDIMWQARTQRLRSVQGPCTIHIDWVEPNRKRDVDNIQSAAKMILDALVSMGVLSGDGQKYVTQVTHAIHVDMYHPRVVVTIEEAV